MTNPCYDFALRPQSNIPNSYVERRHTPQRLKSPSTPSSQESVQDLEFSGQRSDRGRWKTDGRVNIAGGFEDSNSQPGCKCHHCVCSHERNYCDSSSPSPPRRPGSARRPSSAGNCLDQQPGSKKHPQPLPKVDHASWSPLQLLRRPHTSTERGRQHETSRLNSSSSKSRSSSRLRSDTPSRPRDVRESYSPNRVPYRSSKVRSLRRTSFQPRKQSPRKSSPGRCSSKTPSLSRRKSYVDTGTSPCREKFDIACQTRWDEFPLTPDETPRASPIRRVIPSNRSYYDRPSHKSRPLSSSGQRKPSPCRCGAASCAPTPALPRECCCSACVGWQERTQCQKPTVAPQPSCQSGRHGNCCGAVVCHQGNCNPHQICHHAVCHRAEPTSVRHSECSKCHQPLTR